MKKELLAKIAKLSPLELERLELDIEDFMRRTTEQGEFAARQAKEAELQIKEKKAEEEKKEKAEPLNAVNAINTAVREIAEAHSLDLTKTKDYEQAWKLARQKRPELFPARK